MGALGVGRVMPEGDEPFCVIPGQVFAEPGRHPVRLSPGFIVAVEADKMDRAEIKGIVCLAP